MELKLNDVVFYSEFNDESCDESYGLVVEQTLNGLTILWEDDEQMYYPNETIEEFLKNSCVNAVSEDTTPRVFHRKRKLITDMYMNR